MVSQKQYSGGSELEEWQVGAAGHSDSTLPTPNDGYAVFLEDLAKQETRLELAFGMTHISRTLNELSTPLENNRDTNSAADRNS
ncbi:hypothetical protein JTB14_012835 [Gonioctena quinquepunctata]|nr:hypothetical protein JTB14_012835 [Gonioctena quinquepunctata]